MNTTSLRGLRCVGLTRSSSMGQVGDGLSNDQQLDILKSYAAQHGMIWMGEERAEAVSGSQINKRTDIDNLLYRAQTKRDFDILLILSYDRLTRGGAVHGGFLLHSFLLHNVKIVSVTSDIPDNEYAPLIQCIEFIKSNGQAVSISLHTLRGRTASLFDGRLTYCSRPPYAIDRLILTNTGDKLFRIRNFTDGTQVKLKWENDEVIERYRKNPSRSDPNKYCWRHFEKHVDQRIVLIPGATEAVEAVKLMFKFFYIEDVGMPGIAKELNRRGIPSPEGKLWNSSTVCAVVYNTIYVQHGIANRRAGGIYHYRPSVKGVEPIRTNNPMKLRRYRPQSDWVTTRHPEINIIPPEHRDKILAIQLNRYVKWSESRGGCGHKGQARREARSNSPHLLVGAIFDKSGKSMYGVRTGPKKGFRSYMRRLAETFENDSKRKAFSAIVLEKAVVAALAEVLGDIRQFAPMLTDHASVLMSGLRQDVLGLQALETQREAIRQKKAFTLSEYGDVGPERLRTMIAPLTAQIASLTERIVLAEKVAGAGQLDAAEIVQTVLDEVQAISKKISSMASAPLRSIVRLFSRTVVDVDAQEAEIEIRLPEEALSRAGAIKQLCEMSTFTQQCGQFAHNSNWLILARFHCVATRNYSPRRKGRPVVLTTTRVAVDPSLKKAA